MPTCDHVFCRSCLGELFHRNINDIHRCPLCRTALPPTENAGALPGWLAGAPVVESIAGRLRDEFPDIFARRKAEAELRAASSISLLVGHRVTTVDNGDPDGWSNGRRLPPKRVVELFAEVIAPDGWRPRRPNGPNCSALLIDMVNIDTGDRIFDPVVCREGHVLHMAPFEQRVESLQAFEGVQGADDSSAPFTATITVHWKPRLGLPEMRIEHRVDPFAHTEEGEEVSTRYEAKLAEGLTLARVLQRAKPVARIGVGSAMETEVYR